MKENRNESLDEEILEETFKEAKSKIEKENREREEASIKNKTSTKEEETNKEKKEESKEEIKEEQKEEKKIERTVPFEDYLKIKYQLADMINKYKQLDGEFENYRKRTREEIKQASTDGLVKAIEVMLPALDSFKKAKKIVKDKQNLDGINLVEKSLLQALEKHNVKKINCVGKQFNPDYHNAVAIVEDKTKKSGTVVEEIESGYTLNDKVIKFSQVVVSK